MATNQKIQFKDQQEIIIWLDAALHTEREKYKQFPVLPDVMPGYEATQAWGYVVAGYFLIEESFKALLYIRKIGVPTKHSLTMLFDLFKPDDKDVLRDYYSDYRATVGGHRADFQFTALDEFLKNLDGDPNQKGTDHIGSFDWRYFLIEEPKSQNMPFISIDYLHEVAYGCNEIAKSAYRGEPATRQYTHSRRMYFSRQEKYQAWLTVRMNSDGWGELPDRWEILWGPDYRERYDLLLFKGKGMEPFLSEWPENPALPIFDKRKELEEYDVEKGYGSIGMTVINPPLP